MQKPELTVPEPKIASLSFCDTNTRQFRSWVSHLPMANLGELSRQLYHAIIELNQLLTTPAQRLQLLELIRPRIRFVCSELSRHYLGMAIALPEKQRKIANLSQALQLHLANGYKLTLMELLDNGSVDRNRKNLALACHRAITELGATLLRAQQLYASSPAGSWHESHQLFRFARQHGLQDSQIADDELQHRAGSTIADTYYRSLLLGCARANQLRQNELEQVHELFELWSGRVTCGPELTSSAVFLVDPDSDSPPVYRALVPDDDSKHQWGFDTASLAEEIREHLHLQGGTRETAGGSRRRSSGARTTTLPLVAGVSDTLLAHLCEAFTLLTQRNFNRLASEGQLEVCAGLTAVHYFLAGGTPFNEFVIGSGNTENRFMQPVNRDAWSEAHDAGVSDEKILANTDAPIHYQGAGTPADSAQHRNLPRSYLTRMVNTSPGGYCVIWSASIPPTLQAGEILGIREQRNHPWSVALVRWLKQAKGEGTRVGIEVIAPNATPCGVQLIQKTGNSSEFLRGLLLPAIPGVRQSASLVTPKLPFQSGSRITLLQGGVQDQGVLGQRLAATGSISQFELRLYNQTNEGDTGAVRAAPQSKTEDEFDSLWPSL
ncbi:GTPase [Marinobacter daqiaonensis]|nr:GTPase [Marinobacter daqiaonensis]